MRLQAVIFDWAGTLVDHGSRAPVATMRKIFEGAGIPVTDAEIRVSMGVAKLDHIRSILQLPRVAAEAAHRDAETLYKAFVPLQLECLGDYSTLIDGVAGTAAALRARGIRIGSTTGYTREMLDFLLVRAREQGFVPDCAVSPEEVPGGGRPGPWMCYLNAIRLRVAPLWAMAKIGDTPSDIEEGLNAGMWTVGVTRTGNEAGLTQEEWNEVGAAERAQIGEDAGRNLLRAGAHYLVESVGECMDVIEDIDRRIAAGERPLVSSRVTTFEPG